MRESCPSIHISISGKVIIAAYFISSQPSLGNFVHAQVQATSHSSPRSPQHRTPEQPGDAPFLDYLLSHRETASVAMATIGF
jgi:hypothetical protein